MKEAHNQPTPIEGSIDAITFDYSGKHITIKKNNKN